MLNVAEPTLVVSHYVNTFSLGAYIFYVLSPLSQLLGLLKGARWWRRWKWGSGGLVCLVERVEGAKCFVIFFLKEKSLLCISIVVRYVNTLRALVHIFHRHHAVGVFEQKQTANSCAYHHRLRAWINKRRSASLAVLFSSARLSRSRRRRRRRRSVKLKMRRGDFEF